MKLLIEVELSDLDRQAIRHGIRDAQTGCCPNYALPVSKTDLSDAATSRAWIKGAIARELAKTIEGLKIYEVVKAHNESK